LDNPIALSGGKGGLIRGKPLFPSIEAISAVSSPQTKAPAHLHKWSDIKVETRPHDVLSDVIFFPADFKRTFLIRLTASGYSALI
jgi:hypothetical protein